MTSRISGLGAARRTCTTLCTGVLALGALPAVLAGCDDPTGVAPVASVEITAPARFLDARQTMQLSVEAHDRSRRPVTPAGLVWSSSDATVATVVDGVVSAWSPGTVTIAVRAAGARDSIVLIVEEEVGSLSLTPAAITLGVGAGRVLHPLLRDRAGRELQGHTVVWSVKDSSVARVDSAGTVHGVGMGSTVVRVVAGAHSGEVGVTVVMPYTLTPLASFGGSAGRAVAINEQGQVVGTASLPKRPDDLREGEAGFLWSGGQVTRLDFIPRDINGRGEIIGAGRHTSVSVWSNGQWRTLARRDWMGRPDEWSDFSSYALNDAGAVAGEMTNYTEATRIDGVTGAMAVSAAGVRFLGTLGGVSAYANDINEAGALAGAVRIFGYEPRAFVEAGGQLRFLTTAAIPSEAQALNEKGEVVGYFRRSEQPQRRAALWRDGETVDLGVLSGTVSSEAADLNGRGEVVGISSEAYPGRSFGFLWREGRMMDLNDLIPGSEWDVLAATGINDRGQIVGSAMHRQTRATIAILLTPVSEITP